MNLPIIIGCIFGLCILLYSLIEFIIQLYHHINELEFKKPPVIPAESEYNLLAEAIADAKTVKATSLVSALTSLHNSKIYLDPKEFDKLEADLNKYLDKIYQ